MSHQKKHQKLGEFFATAICGNDIMSSALYVSGIAIVYAGTYAPLVLLSIGIVLYFFRTVYREVVEALPVNGGAYNALLNSTYKPLASIAGVMTILSYIATAVISAKTAVEYLFYFLERILPAFNLFNIQLAPFVLPVTALVLFVFALIVIMGVKDSAKVAATIFSTHIATLIIFVVGGLIFYFLHGSADIATANTAATDLLVIQKHGLWAVLFFGFSASLLGVSGFESSANFVEEQKHGVFHKTLRNMMLGVMVFNPLIAFVILKAMPMVQIVAAKDFILADAAHTIGGMTLLGIISVDAFFVLCGAVLTSYVGVSGLVHRMAIDECLPHKLIKANRHGSHYRIILTFFLLSLSILLVTQGDLLSLAGVYTISFLGVMTLFAGANLMLRKSRSELKRPYSAPLPFVLLALIAAASGMLGNIALSPKNTAFFLMYFIPAIFITLTIVFKKDVYASFARLFRWFPSIHKWFEHKHELAMHSRTYVFVRHPDRMFRILQYIKNNENGNRVTIVHCRRSDATSKDELELMIPVLHRAGVFPDLQVEFDYLRRRFSPEVLDEYAKKHHISKNRIFMGSIHHTHDFNYQDLGGVRIIF